MGSRDWTLRTRFRFGIRPTARNGSDYAPCLQDKAERAVMNQTSDSPKYTTEEWSALSAKTRKAELWATDKAKPSKTSTSGLAEKIPFLPSNTSSSAVLMRPPS